jgi:hypothetical protein
MVSVCAGETTLGHLMMWAPIIVLIGVVFHGLHGKRQNMQPPLQEDSYLTVPLAPVTP